MNRMNRREGGQVLRALFVAIGLGGGIALVWWSFPLVYPFLLGWLLAYALRPLVDLLHRRARLPRWLAVTAALALFAASALTIVSALVMRLVAELMALSGSLETVVARIERSFEALIGQPDIQELIARINTFYEENPNYQKTINSRLSDTADAIAAAGYKLVSGFLDGIVHVLSSLPQVATIAVVVLLASFFIGKDWPRHRARVAGLLPAALRKRAAVVWRDLRQALFGYAQAQFLLITLTTVVIIAGLSLLGVKQAISIGLAIGLVDLLPYVGVGAVMVPWFGYAFLSGDWQLGVGLASLYGVVVVARQILEPKVLASSVGLDPLATLIAMFVGLQLLGFFGLIVGPVTIVVLSALHRAGVFRDLGRFIAYGIRS